jgi:hypothetical protein
MSATLDATPDRPPGPRGVEQSPLDLLLNAVHGTSTETTAVSNLPMNNISQEQVALLLQRLQEQQATIARLLQNNTNTNKPKTADYYNIAKYEDIICKGIKPPYDGSSDQLIPFLNRLDIRRQDESWYPSTFISIGSDSFDLTRQFAKVSESDITAAAESRWTSPTIATDKITLDHPAYNARVFGRLLMASITDEFSLTVISRIPQDLRNDGPLLLWTICNHIHRNNIAFIETIKSKIREATLSTFGDDVEKYILYIKDNMRLITATATDSTEHNDLITYPFTQLTKSTITMFKEAVQKWQIDYLEAKMLDLTPTKLLKMADDKAQVLRHAGHWHTVDSPAVMALKLELEQERLHSQTLVKNLAAHVGQFIQKQRHKPTSGGTPYQHPEWMITPPSPGIFAMMHDGKHYNWCTKCRQGKGLWVLRHTTTTHVDGFRRQPKRQHSQGQEREANRPKYDPPHPMAHYSDLINEIPPEPQEQLSLNDYLNSYFINASTQH